MAADCTVLIVLDILHESNIWKQKNTKLLAKTASNKRCNVQSCKSQSMDLKRTKPTHNSALVCCGMYMTTKTFYTSYAPREHDCWKQTADSCSAPVTITMILWLLFHVFIGLPQVRWESSESFLKTNLWMYSNNLHARHLSVIQRTALEHWINDCVKCKIPTYLTPTADNVPTGILCDGLRRSPLILIPAKTPVAVGKNTPNTVKKDSPAA